MSDIRDLASEYIWWTSYSGFTAYTAIGTDGSVDSDGEPIERKVVIHYIVCPVCDGRGSYVNPNIDRQGLSREDFDADPDFADDYMTGRFDIACALCNGKSTIPEASQEAERKEIETLLQATISYYENEY